MPVTRRSLLGSMARLGGAVESQSIRGGLSEIDVVLPAASFEMVQESIRSSRMQMETARDIMRMLRDLR